MSDVRRLLAIIIITATQNSYVTVRDSLLSDRYNYWNGATRGHMSPLAITTPSQSLCAGPSGPGRVGMRLSAYFGKRLHAMLSWTHVHV